MPHGPNPPPSYGAKNLGDYRSLGRGPYGSFYRRLAATTGFRPSAGVFERLAAFTSLKNLSAWLGHILRYVGGDKYPFQVYCQPETGIFPVSNELTLSMAGDWGTGTDEAEDVARQMRANQPDYTIHLGDVYYVGDCMEVEEHCLGRQGPNPRIHPVRWPLGTKGSFALNGNHEMYALGAAYFMEFLPRLGPIDPATGRPAGQGASFFCLMNDYWKVIGLDTGYNSTGLSTLFSFLSKIKWIKWLRKTPCFKPSCRLPDELLQWLGSVTASDSDGRTRGLILLSHHQYYSGFDDWYVRPALQLAQFIPDRTVLWFWGHEHRMALYDQFSVLEGISTFGRCIGHGGMPVSRGVSPDIDDCHCILYDDRRYPTAEGINVGYNGFVNLTFDGPCLRADYFDLFNTLLLTEKWCVDAKGQLTGPGFVFVHPELTRCDPAYIARHRS